VGKTRCIKCKRLIPYGGRGRPRKICTHCRSGAEAKLRCPRCNAAAKVKWTLLVDSFILEGECKNCGLIMWTEGYHRQYYDKRDSQKEPKSI